MESKKFVYFFGGGKAEGKGTMKEVLGGKGAGLAEMTNIGLPVPSGFTITTEVCDHHYRNDKKYPRGFSQELEKNLKRLEKLVGKKLGDPEDPLLVSVRSGAARSMPGMMETILNLGLNDTSVEGLASKTKNRRFALDAYRRFILMYGATAMGVARHKFDYEFDDIKERVTRVRLNTRKARILDTQDLHRGPLDAHAHDVGPLLVHPQQAPRILALVAREDERQEGVLGLRELRLKRLVEQVAHGLPLGGRLPQVVGADRPAGQGLRDGRQVPRAGGVHGFGEVAALTPCRRIEAPVHRAAPLALVGDRFLGLGQQMAVWRVGLPAQLLPDGHSRHLLQVLPGVGRVAGPAPGQVFNPGLQRLQAHQGVQTL